MSRRPSDVLLLVVWAVMASVSAHAFLSDSTRPADRGFAAVFLLIALSAIPFSLAPLIKDSRIRAPQIRGLCLNCGYDLRASPTRCPECGTIALLTPPGE